MSDDIPDGIDALRKVLSLKQIMNLISQTAKWVAPETFSLLPIWYPEYGRRSPFYKGNWSEVQLNKNRQTGIELPKLEGNIHANKALTLALGLRAKERPSWSCCHLWGVDDNLYQAHNSIVQDRRFFSCIGNMVLMPTPLKAFTDVMPEVKLMLRVCSKNLYGWTCEHPDADEANKLVSSFSNWEDYPEVWPKSPLEKIPPGTVALNDRIRKSARERTQRIKSDVQSAGPFYPKEEVLQVLKFWKVDIFGEA